MAGRAHSEDLRGHRRIQALGWRVVQQLCGPDLGAVGARGQQASHPGTASAGRQGTPSGDGDLSQVSAGKRLAAMGGIGAEMRQQHGDDGRVAIFILFIFWLGHTHTHTRNTGKGESLAPSSALATSPLPREAPSWEAGTRLVLPVALTPQYTLVGAVIRTHSTHFCQGDSTDSAPHAGVHLGYHHLQSSARWTVLPCELCWYERKDSFQDGTCWTKGSVHSRWDSTAATVTDAPGVGDGCLLHILRTQRLQPGHPEEREKLRDQLDRTCLLSQA